MELSEGVLDFLGSVCNTEPVDWRGIYAPGGLVMILRTGEIACINEVHGYFIVLGNGEYVTPYDIKVETKCVY